MRRAVWLVLGIVSQIGASACAPLPVTYYMPSALNGEVQRWQCDNAPPYQVVVAIDRMRISAFFDGSGLMIALYPAFHGAIDFDARTLRITAEGVDVGVTDVTYGTPDEKAPTPVGLNGNIHVSGGTIYIRAKVVARNPAEIAVHLPPITVDGVTVEPPVFSFHRERNMRLRALVLNC